MFSPEIIRKVFNEGRLSEDSFLNYYRDVLIRKDGLVVILIDMQQGFLDYLNNEEQERIILNQMYVIRWCAQENIPIVVLEYKRRKRTIDILIEELESVKNLEIIEKSHDDGFSNAELDYYLKKIGAKNLFLMGINASYCVKETAQGGIEKGYKIITSNDVIACRGGDNSISWYEENGTVISSTDLRRALFRIKRRFFSTK